MGRTLVASVPLRLDDVTCGACHSLGFLVPVGGTLSPCWLASRPIFVAGRCVLTAVAAHVSLILSIQSHWRNAKPREVVQRYIGSTTHPCLSFREIWFSCHKGNVGRCWHHSRHCESALEEAGQRQGFSTFSSQSTTWKYGLMVVWSCCNPM